MDSSVLIPRLHVAAAPAQAVACANCEAPRVGEYCYRCGQHFLEGRLTIRQLVMDFVVRKLGLEGGLLRTVVDLTVRPHAMIRNYVDGRRQRYTNPVAYLLLVGGLYVLVSRTWADSLAAGIRAQSADEGADVQALTEPLVQVQLYMDAHPSLATVLLCLFLVPALRLLFRRTTTTAESSIFALYVSGHLLLMQIAIALGAMALSADVYRATTGPATMVPALLLLVLAGRFYGTRLSSHLKVALAVAITTAGLLVLMMMAALIIALATAAPAGAAG
jgi:hypothetical protein